MASVSFRVLKGKKNGNIYCRFMQGSCIDVTSKIDVYVDSKNWDYKHQKIKNVISIKNRDLINRKLAQLKIDIIDKYNISYMEGEVIDRIWLVNVINEFFKRPKGDKQKNSNHNLYFVDFAEWWLKEKSSSWLTSANSYMNDRIKGQYESFLEIVKEFQGKSNIKLSKSGYDTITKFVKYLSEGGYSEKTIKRHISRFKFFFLRAKAEGFKIDETFTQRIYVPKTEEVLEPILDEFEIEKIYNLHLENEALDNARDNLIIACWTGLRISDFNNKLDISNFIDDTIQITTTKTKSKVVIPIHPMVKRILVKRNGKLPKKINDSTFNKQIKVICKQAGLTKKMRGRLFGIETKRKIIGDFEKYKLISSHIGRRSFATNHYGKIDDYVIMGICGWKSKEMMLNYIKKSSTEHAVRLKQYWEETYK